MHELSIAEAILDAVRSEAEKRPGAHIAKVAVRVGALSGVEPEALSFGFDCLVRGTDLEPLALVIVPVPRRQRCPACDLTFDVPDAEIEIPGADMTSANAGALERGLRTPDFGPSLACPRCAHAETVLAGGEELEMAYLEIEE
jgi:hydrogenase nickel incorporation protein HypA/HybF